MIGAECPRGALLGRPDGPGVVEQLAQRLHGVRRVGEQDVVAEELAERPAGLALGEQLAASVARAPPDGRITARPLHECREERGGVGIGDAGRVVAHVTVRYGTPARTRPLAQAMRTSWARSRAPGATRGG